MIKDAGYYPNKTMDNVILKKKKERERRRRTHLLCHSRQEIYCMCVALQSRVVNSVYGY